MSSHQKSHPITYPTSRHLHSGPPISIASCSDAEADIYSALKLLLLLLPERSAWSTSSKPRSEETKKNEEICAPRLRSFSIYVRVWRRTILRPLRTLQPSSVTTRPMLLPRFLGSSEGHKTLTTINLICCQKIRPC